VLICAGNGESFVGAVPMGVGLIEMSINLTRLCLFDPPAYLLFVGSAGSYGDHEIFDLVESKSAANIELSFLLNSSYTPLDNIIKTTTEQEVIVNSSNYITTDKELASKFLPLGIGLENMEFFAFLRVAQEFDIPAGGLFCVTNYCHVDAHAEFVGNSARAKKLLEDRLL